MRVSKALYSEKGFTLIELSIVLVIIGLIIGGILTGQDLINAATIRAQLSQIEKYNTAVRTFQGKYGYLPGDIPNPQATNFGFQARGIYSGEGDGNGILQGNCANTSVGSSGNNQGCGELAVFWQDLSVAGLIDAGIPIGTNQPSITGPVTGSCCVTIPAGPGLLTKWLPQAKLGNNQFIYIYSTAGMNYFAVQQVTKMGWSLESTGVAGAGGNSMTVIQAYNIDKKADDGLPQTGSITACDDDYDVTSTLGYLAVWAAGKSQVGAAGTGTSTTNCIPTTAITPVANTNCFDNNNLGGVETYSLSQNAGAQNCALSFRFQ